MAIRYLNEQGTWQDQPLETPKQQTDVVSNEPQNVATGQNVSESSLDQALNMYRQEIDSLEPERKQNLMQKAGDVLQDVYHVTAKGVSGAMAGAPENITKRPIDFALSGLPGLQANVFDKPEKNQLPFTSPATTSGELAGNVAEFGAGFLNPSLAIRPIAGLAVKPQSQNMARRIMTGILKPKGDNPAQAVETVLKEGVAGTRGSMLEQMYKKLNQAGVDIAEKIKPHLKGDININKVTKEMNDVIKQAKEAKNFTKAKSMETLRDEIVDSYKTMKQISFTKRVGGVSDEFGEITPITKQIKQTRKVYRPVSVEEAQNTKQAIYRDIAGDKGYPFDSSASGTQLRMATARGLKKGIEQKVPEIAEANRYYGNLSEATDDLARQFDADQQKALFGLGDVVLGSAGGVNPKSLAVMAGRKLMQMPNITSRIARALYNPDKLGKTATVIPAITSSTRAFNNG